MDAISSTLGQAVALHQAGRLSEAAGLYGKVLSVDPGNPDALHLLGLVARRKGKSDEGIQLMMEAVKRDPLLVSAHFNLANALLETGRLEEAEASFHRLLHLQPDDPGIQAQLGRLLLRRGAFAESEPLFARAFARASDPRVHLAAERARRYRGVATAAFDPRLPAGLVVRGVFRDSSGYAYKVRQFVRHLVAAGVRVQLMDLLYGPMDDLAVSQLDPLFQALDAPVRAKAVLSFTTPPVVETIPGLHTINYTVFEATRIPPLWAAHSRRHDHVIVATPSSRDAWIAAGHAEDRIALCPEGVDPVAATDVIPMTVIDSMGRRLSAYPTRVLNISDFNPRKNLKGLLRTWLSSTRAGDPAALVLKIGKGADDTGEFQALIGETARSTGVFPAAAAPIFLIAAKLSDREMLSLCGACTHYWSMSHGEGWDLSMAQAGAMGLTLIAPGHSAYTAYLNDQVAHLLPCVTGPATDGYTGLEWWFPDEAAAGALLTTLIRDPGAQRRSARQHLLAGYTWDKAARRLIEALMAVGAL